MIVNKKTIWWKLHILCYSIHCVICDHHIRYKFPHCTISSIALLSSVLSISLNICSYSTIIYNIIIILIYLHIILYVSNYVYVIFKKTCQRDISHFHRPHPCRKACKIHLARVKPMQKCQEQQCGEIFKMLAKQGHKASVTTMFVGGINLPFPVMAGANGIVLPTLVNINL